MTPLDDRARGDFPIPNTLRVASFAQFGCTAHDESGVAEAFELAARHSLPVTFSGAGSNLIPMPRVARVVCVVAIRGVEVVHDARDAVRIRVGAGEPWHDLVQRTLREGWFGLENLSLIPGCTGAAPVQNIGAYGREISEFVETVHVMTDQGQSVDVPASECGFGYRRSVFQERADLAITAVTLRLPKRPEVEVSYPDLQAWFGDTVPTPLEVASAVVHIRSSKLPDPAMHPNVGSFFKNPVVTPDVVADLRKRVAKLRVWDQGGAHKLSAAQLIDQAGWKTRGTARVHCWDSQPLVLINAGASQAPEVLAFAQSIQDDVRERYSVELELEPSVLR